MQNRVFFVYDSIMIDLIYEKELLSKYRYVAGSDEAGRGCLAGPVVAACVVLNDLRIVLPMIVCLIY